MAHEVLAGRGHESVSERNRWQSKGLSDAIPPPETAAMNRAAGFVRGCRTAPYTMFAAAAALAIPARAMPPRQTTPDVSDELRHHKRPN